MKKIVRRMPGVFAFAFVVNFFTFSSFAYAISTIDIPENSAFEDRLHLLCAIGSGGVVNVLVRSRDNGVSREDALRAIASDWDASMKDGGNGFFLPGEKPSEAQKLQLSKWADYFSVLVYELPKASSEVLQIVVKEQCVRAFSKRRLLTANELKVKIFGVEACPLNPREARYACLSALFSLSTMPAVSSQKNMGSITVGAADIGLDNAFPAATISFVPQTGYGTLSDVYRFKFELGEISPQIKSGVFDSGMGYLGGPAQLFWCGLRHVGRLINKDVVITSIENQNRTSASGVAVFVDADDPFSSVTNNPLGGQWPSLMSIGQLQAKCGRIESSQKIPK